MPTTEPAHKSAISPVIELRDIRAVAIIAEERSITRAAVRLNIAQPALSRRIRAIETRLGVRLFQRTPSGVEPTAAGRVLLEQGGDLINASHRLLDAVRASGGSAPTVLRMGMSAFGASVPRIRQAVARFQARHPDVAIEPSSIPSTRQGAAVVADELDVGFGTEPIVHDRVAAHVVVTEQVTGALLADDHPLADRDMITLADLEGLDVIMPSAQVNPITYQRTYETLARLGRRRPPRVMVENPAEGLSLIAAGIAFGLGFESLRRNPLNMLRLVPVEGLAMPMPVYCYAPRWSEREFVPTFVQYVLEEAAQ